MRQHCLSLKHLLFLKEVSTFRQKVIRGDKDAAIESLLQYCKAGGKVLRGLESRRKDEAALFKSTAEKLI